VSEHARETIDLQAIVARIDRDLMESRKLREESDKLSAERRKLEAEELKLRREWRLAPWSLVVGTLAAALAGGAFVNLIARWL
jgi:hypothetical protein